MGSSQQKYISFSYCTAKASIFSGRLELPNLHKSFHEGSTISTTGLDVILWVVVIFHPQGNSDDLTSSLYLDYVSGNFGQNHLRDLVNQMCNQAVVTSSYRLSTGGEYLICWLTYSTEIRAVTLEQSWFNSSDYGLHWRLESSTGSMLCVPSSSSVTPLVFEQKSPSLKCHFLSLLDLIFTAYSDAPDFQHIEHPLGQSSVYFSVGAENRLSDYGLHERSVWWNSFSTYAVGFFPFQPPSQKKEP